MKTIGIYCSASEDIKTHFEQEAIKLGHWMGENKMTLVNGGSNRGLMEIFAKAVRNSGGLCTGVIPENLAERGWHSNQTDKVILVKNLSERKEVIKTISDVLIAFPGGIGTMDEFFDAWASYSLGYHHKKIILVNLGGYYTPLVEQLNVFKKEGFLHDFLPSPLIVVDTAEECIDRIREMNLQL